MSDLRSLVVKRAAFGTLKNDIRVGLGHAYIVVCEDIALREEFIKTVAQSIFCPAGGCGECKVCRLIEEGNFFDVKGYDGDGMKVADMEELTEDAQIIPVQTDKKLFIIDNAEKMTPAVQNKLLKTYEEPPRYLTVILSCGVLNGLLPTIRSRAKILYLDGLTSEEAAEYLTDKGYDEENARIAAAVGGGNLYKSEAFLSDEGHINQYNACFELLTKLDSSADIVDYLYGDLFSKDNVLLTLEFMEIILCDVLNITAKSGVPLRNSGREFDIGKIAEKFTSESATLALYAINEGRKKLSSNMSATTVAEGILFDILEARYKWQK